MELVIGVLVGLAVGVAAVVVAARFLLSRSAASTSAEHERLTDDARRAAEAIRREAQVEAREEALKLRAEVDQEVRDKRAEIIKIEERVLAKEEEIDRKLTDFAGREQSLNDREGNLKEMQEKLDATTETQLRELERISGMTIEEAKRHVLERSEELVRHEMARMVRQAEEEARTESKRRARNLVADTPQAVVLSSFDGVRREVAKLTLSKLVEDGRIHPSRIEEMYYRSKAEIEEHIRQAGEQAVFEANCGKMHEELAKILGRLRYRTSYGQNILKHSLECA